MKASERLANVATAADLCELLRAWCEHCEICSRIVLEVDPEDGGGWVNCDVELFDGTTIPSGRWFRARENGYEDEAYSLVEIYEDGGGGGVSAELQAAFDRLADEDGRVKLDDTPEGTWCDSASELVCRIAVDYVDISSELREAFAAAVRTKIDSALDDTDDPDDMLRVARALRIVPADL
jgi:hypothetical protein